MALRTVSVVIPTRERPDLLARTLRSVLGQRGVAVEVLVVDDGSPPGTYDAVEGVGDARVTLLHHPVPLGVSHARNTGIEAAGADWLAFVDDDDLWAPDKLSAQLAAVESSAASRWSCVGTVTIDGAARIIGCRHPLPDTDIAVHMLVDDVIPGGGSGVLVRRDLLDAAGPFDCDLSCNADWDMYLRLAQHAPVAPVDRPLLAYRVHRRAMSLDVSGCDRDFDRMLQKYADLRAARGVTVDRLRWAEWKSSTYLRTGDRRRSRQALAGTGPIGVPWHRRGRAAAITALPGAVRLRDYRQGRRVPPSWRAEVSSWLPALG